MDKTIYNLKITLTEPLLGTQSTKNVATNYLQEKARSRGIDVADELETLPDILEKGTTVFHKDKDGKPIYYDYMVRGFLKESARVQNPLIIDGKEIKQLRSIVDNHVFVSPRRIKFKVPDDMELELIEYPFAGFNLSEDGALERSLRAETAQGPRTALARSEALPTGTSFECQLVIAQTSKSKEKINENVLRALLEYGELKGFGQWRNASFGRFTYELEKVE